MARASTTFQEIPRHGKPAIIVRSFGWAMLFLLAAYLINNVLVVWFDFPGLRGLGGEDNARALIEAGLFIVAILAGIGVVIASRDLSLRWDAHRVHMFNRYLARALFWSVFLVGIGDATIAFLRTESLIDPLFGEAAARNLARANWTGSHVHTVLIAAGFVIAAFTRSLSFIWLSLLIVLAELLIVISRFVFSYEQALMGDLVRYWYATLFLFASAYTLYDEGHVRVDILYAGLNRRTKGLLNAVGSVLLGMTTSWVILFVALNGPQSIVNAPVRNFEISQAGPFGMYVKYQMAAFIALFGVSMLIEFVSYFFNSVADMRDEPGHREPSQASAH
ncbi:MAG: TRAP transporter small permease subunit [Alphaproteobacteria bacterium]|nr:MAG: TRAP transporter small permease subunit [Alphaproteobacteria bacterium]